MVEKKDEIIGNLKREILSLNDQLFDKQKEVYKEKEAFERLHEAYMILQHHNEENLALRLTTEDRLKSLFKRDRRHADKVKKAQESMQNDKDTLKSNAEHIKFLTEEVINLRNNVIEKDGMNSLMKTEMLA